MSDGIGRHGRPAWRGESSTSRLDGPRRPVAIVQFQRDDAQDLAVLNVHVYRPTGGEVGKANNL